MKIKPGIKTKMVIATVCFMCLLTASVAGIGYNLYHHSVMQSYIDYTDTVLEYAYRASVEYHFGEMIAYRDMPETYEEFRSELNAIKEDSDIEYLYAIYFDDINDMHSLHYAINAKTNEELSDGRPLSEIYTFMGKAVEDGAFEDETLTTLWQAVKEGKQENGFLDGYSEGYGHMLNGYRVVFDDEGNAVGLICVEIDINRINVELRHYVEMVVLIAFIITAVIIVMYVFNIDRYLIKPIVRIAKNSDSFVKKMQNNSEPEDLVFDEVNVRSDNEIRMLADDVKSMADGVAEYMTNLKAATSEKERISTELSLATRLQYSMLPHDFPPFPDRKEFDIYAMMKPAREVGGDFYDFFLIDEDHLGLVIADVSGKGIPAALFMMISKIIIQSCAMLGQSAADILNKTNEALCSNNQMDMFVTVWVGILEISTGKLTAANAGHEYPVIKKNNGSFELFKDKHSLAVGGMEEIRYKEYEIMLEPGDKLFLYTDGVPEATDSDNNMFRSERMLEALNSEADADPKKILENVKAAVSGFVKDAEQFDDLTMMCIEYKG